MPLLVLHELEHGGVLDAVVRAYIGCDYLLLEEFSSAASFVLTPLIEVVVRLFVILVLLFDYVLWLFITRLEEYVSIRAAHEAHGHLPVCGFAHLLLSKLAILLLG